MIVQLIRVSAFMPTYIYSRVSRNNQTASKLCHIWLKNCRQWNHSIVGISSKAQYCSLFLSVVCRFHEQVHVRPLKIRVTELVLNTSISVFLELQFPPQDFSYFLATFGSVLKSTLTPIKTHSHENR